MNELATFPNPFRDNVVQDAWQRPDDVEAIHKGAFEACLAVIGSAGENIPDSLLVYGAAGSGKTHLLTRVQRHLTETKELAPDRVLRCLFVFVRLQTSPQLLWQHVRRRFAHDLMRRDQGVTQLQRLLAHQIALHDPPFERRSPRAVVQELRVLGKEGKDELSSQFERIAASLELPHDLSVVLDHLMYDDSVRDGSAWLAGESLPEKVLERLGVSMEPPEDREQDSREVVTKLCKLAGATLPVVFCFDQVEALQRAPDDREAFFRFGRMAADLHDADTNVCVITCLQSAVVDAFEASVRAADLDRMAKRRAVLAPLDREQVEALVKKRLGQVPGLGDSLAPFDATFVDALVRDTPSVPRRVLASCARRFEQLQHGEALPARSTAEFLSGELEERAREAARTSDPADTTRAVLHGLEAISALGPYRAREEEPGVIDVVLESAEKGSPPLAISVRNEADGRSLGPKLKKLLAAVPRADGARLVVIRDPRLPISKAAKKTRESLAALRKKGASLVEPSLEALAALSALAAILSDAKSGDLANEGEAVGESAVLAWLRAAKDHHLALEPVKELLTAMSEAEVVGSESDDEQDLAELLAAERVVSAEDASKLLGLSVDRLVEVARARRDHFLLLEGPPIVIADVAGVAPEVL